MKLYDKNTHIIYRHEVATLCRSSTDYSYRELHALLHIINTVHKAQDTKQTSQSSNIITIKVWGEVDVPGEMSRSPSYGCFTAKVGKPILE